MNKYTLLDIANALLTVSESLSLVRDYADEKEQFEKQLDYLQTVVADLKSKAASNTSTTASAIKATALLLLGVTNFVNNVMIDAEAVRDVDAGLVNILDADCIEVLKRIRYFNHGMEVTD